MCTLTINYRQIFLYIIVFAVNLKNVLNTSWKRFEDVLQTSSRRITKVNIFVFKTSSEDKGKGHLQDVLTKMNVYWVLPDFWGIRLWRLHSSQIFFMSNCFTRSLGGLQKGPKFDLPLPVLTSQLPSCAVCFWLKKIISFYYRDLLRTVTMESLYKNGVFNC